LELSFPHLSKIRLWRVWQDLREGDKMDVIQFHTNAAAGSERPLKSKRKSGHHCRFFALLLLEFLVDKSAAYLSSAFGKRSGGRKT